MAQRRPRANGDVAQTLTGVRSSRRTARSSKRSRRSDKLVHRCRRPPGARGARQARARGTNERLRLCLRPVLDRGVGPSRFATVWPDAGRAGRSASGSGTMGFLDGVAELRCTLTGFARGQPGSATAHPTRSWPVFKVASRRPWIRMSCAQHGRTGETATTCCWTAPAVPFREGRHRVPNRADAPAIAPNALTIECWRHDGELISARPCLPRSGGVSSAARSETAAASSRAFPLDFDDADSLIALCGDRGVEIAEAAPHQRGSAAQRRRDRRWSRRDLGGHGELHRDRPARGQRASGDAAGEATGIGDPRAARAAGASGHRDLPAGESARRHSRSPSTSRTARERTVRDGADERCGRHPSRRSDVLVAVSSRRRMTATGSRASAGFLLPATALGCHVRGQRLDLRRRRRCQAEVEISLRDGGWRIDGVAAGRDQSADRERCRNRDGASSRSPPATRSGAWCRSRHRTQCHRRVDCRSRRPAWRSAATARTTYRSIPL